MNVLAARDVEPGVASRVLIGVGALAVVAGIIFALQGFSVLGGSTMSGSSLWAVLGPLIALAGLLLGAAGPSARQSTGTSR
jgi:hypothetical protein